MRIDTYTFKQLGLDWSKQARAQLLSRLTEVELKAQLAAIAPLTQADFREDLAWVVLSEPTLLKGTYHNNTPMRGYHSITLFQLDPAARAVLYVTMIVTKAEAALARRDTPATITLMPRNRNVLALALSPPSAAPDDEDENSDSENP